MSYKVNKKCVAFNKNVQFELNVQRLKNGNGLDLIIDRKKCLMDCKYRKTCPQACTENRYWV